MNHVIVLNFESQTGLRRLTCIKSNVAEVSSGTCQARSRSGALEATISGGAYCRCISRDRKVENSIIHIGLAAVPEKADRRSDDGYGIIQPTKLNDQAYVDFLSAGASICSR